MDTTTNKTIYIRGVELQVPTADMMGIRITDRYRSGSVVMWSKSDERCYLFIDIDAKKMRWMNHCCLVDVTVIDYHLMPEWPLCFAHNRDVGVMMIGFNGDNTDVGKWGTVLWDSRDDD